ncbi:early nodulin-like protein 18 [Elaeis guineensis]|uniref:Blue copper protein n=1 Tax=Elaeis guineensis var. tenera TaxID=51953 RepID=A0A6I9QGV7_ELAGV|nr:blue copper protein [Elaeis guineensis]
MSQLSSCSGLLLFSNCTFYFLISCLFVILLNCQGSNAYKNYTVGDSFGWYDNLMVSKVNYQKWAAGKNFSLGDFLIFNTDKNHTVVQTYNATTYKHCDYNDAEDDDTMEWSAGEPEFSKEAVTVAVPLLKEGLTYFFSGNYDGEQCRHGQHFKINVSHGQGLPPSLKSPSVAPAPTSPDDENLVPDTVVPSNFNNPADISSVNATSGAGEDLRKLGGNEGGRLFLGLGLIGAFLFY